MGGTGANHIMLGTGDAAFYQDTNGNPAPPPAGEIENPNPQPGTNNFYTQDGYGAAGTTNGGSYSNCADHSQPGVAGVFELPDSLHYKVSVTELPAGALLPAQQLQPRLQRRRDAEHVDVHRAAAAVAGRRSATSSRRTGSAGATSARAIDNGNPGPDYCGICDPMQYSTSIMTNPGAAGQHRARPRTTSTPRRPMARCLR